MVRKPLNGSGLEPRFQSAGTRRRLALAVSGFLLPLAVLCCASAPFVPAEEDLSGLERSELRLAVDAEGLAKVDVGVDGEVLHMMLDSGDYACLSLNTEILDRLDVEITGTVTHADMTGRVFRVRTFVAREVVLGSLALHNVPGRENVNGPASFDGTLGNGILAHFGVMLDYARERMELYPRGEQPAFLVDEAWHRVSLLEPGHRLPVRFEGVEGEFPMGFDTGASGVFVSLDSDLGRALLKSLETTRMEGSINGVPTKELRICRLAGILIGDHDAGGSDCAIGPSAGFVGNGFLGGALFGKNRVFLDQERREMWLKRP